MTADMSDVREVVRKVEEAREAEAAKSIAQFQRGLLTVSDLADALAEIIRVNPHRFCWCRKPATYRVTIDIALLGENDVTTINSAGETCVFLCTDHAALASGSAERIED